MTESLGNGANTVELIKGGSLIRVTDLNKQDFIRKKCHFIGYKCVSEQLQSM